VDNLGWFYFWLILAKIWPKTLTKGSKCAIMRGQARNVSMACKHPSWRLEMKIFVFVMMLITVGCAARQTPGYGLKFVEERNVNGIQIKRMTDDGFVSLIDVKFADPVTVTRGSCYYGNNCLMYPSDQGMVTKVIQDDWMVIYTYEPKIEVVTN